MTGFYMKCNTGLKQLKRVQGQVCESLHDDVELLSFRINMLFQAKLLQIKVWEIISSEPIKKFKYHMNGFYQFNSIHVTNGFVQNIQKKLDMELLLYSLSLNVVNVLDIIVG